MNAYPFNDTPDLWVNYRLSNPCTRLRLSNGHVIVGTEVLARFSNDKYAHRMLTMAGYEQKELGFYTPIA